MGIAVMSIYLFVVLAFFLAIPILIGVYVWRDANRRGMNAPLWTIVAVLAPGFIGLIIYLLVRGSWSDLRCPACGGPVREDFARCPRCGAKLKASCPSCSAPVEAGWKVCPHCGSPLAGAEADVAAPVREKDRGLGKILLVVILIPVLLILVLLLSFGAFSAGGDGGAGVTSLPVGEYLDEMDNPNIEAWFDSGFAEDYDTAYVLRHVAEGEEDTRTEFLIYFPRLADQPSISVGTGSGLLGGQELKLAFEDENGSTDNTVVLATCSGDGGAKLTLTYDGKKVPCQITDVDYDLGWVTSEHGVPAMEG